jgi:S1-C subfamily serine protease
MSRSARETYLFRAQPDKKAAAKSRRPRDRAHLPNERLAATLSRVASRVTLRTARPPHSVMKRPPLRGRLVALTILLISSFASLAIADEHTDRAADLIATLQPAVVNITIVRYVRAGAAEGNMAGQATTTEQRIQSSGFFIDPSGIIVTNRHVFQDASEIIVTLHDTTRLRASVLATAAQSSDLALLRVSAGKALPTRQFRR